jgi:hypothetical protein
MYCISVLASDKLTPLDVRKYRLKMMQTLPADLDRCDAYGSQVHLFVSILLTCLRLRPCWQTGGACCGAFKFIFLYNNVFLYESEPCTGIVVRLISLLRRSVGNVGKSELTPLLMHDESWDHIKDPTACCMHASTTFANYISEMNDTITVVRSSGSVLVPSTLLTRLWLY